MHPNLDLSFVTHPDQRMRIFEQLIFFNKKKGVHYCNYILLEGTMFRVFFLPTYGHVLP